FCFPGGSGGCNVATGEAMASRHLKPFQPSGRLVWMVQFRHPLHGLANKKYSLKTQEEATAKRICGDLSAILSDPALQGDALAAGALGYCDEALLIFFGHVPPKKAPPKHALTLQGL